MKFETARESFISEWGNLSTHWGINRTMAQIHAPLLCSENSMSAEEIMEQLSISRGNVSMNLRQLMDWGLVFRDHQPGERKEFFRAEKDIWEVARQIMIQRRRRELEPLKKLVNGLENGDYPEHFRKLLENIHDMTNKSDKLLQKAIAADRGWFTNFLLKRLA